MMFGLAGSPSATIHVGIKIEQRYYVQQGSPLLYSGLKHRHQKQEAHQDFLGDCENLFSRSYNQMPLREIKYNISPLKQLYGAAGHPSYSPEYAEIAPDCFFP